MNLNIRSIERNLSPFKIGPNYHNFGHGELGPGLNRFRMADRGVPITTMNITNENPLNTNQTKGPIRVQNFMV